MFDSIGAGDHAAPRRTEEPRMNTLPALWIKLQSGCLTSATAVAACIRAALLPLNSRPLDPKLAGPASDSDDVGPSPTADPRPAEVEDRLLGCGWFDSSHELQCGLRVQELSPQQVDAQALPWVVWLDLQPA